MVVGHDLPMAAFAAEDEQSSPGISLSQILSILRACWKRSLLILVTLIGVFGFLIKSLPKSYVATATLIANHADTNPLAGADLPAGLQNTFIPTQIELIRSPVVLQPVISRLHLSNDPEFTRGFKGPPAALREAIYSNLYNALNVYQGAGSELLYIAATSKRPDEAANIANAVAAEYLTLNRQRIDQPAVQRAQLYSQELADLRAKTVATQDQVAAFRQTHGLIDLVPSSGDQHEAALSDLEQKLLAAENQERTLQAQLQSRAWSAASPEANGTSELASKLATEESQLAKMRETLGPRHPDVLELESQIAATRQSISSGLSSQLEDARKLVEQYSAAVDAQRGLVLKQRSVQDEGTKLLLELQSAEATYKRALDGYSQIEFASNGDVSDVSLVSSAAPPARAAKPNKIKYFLVSCVLSFGLALGLPFGYELFLNRRLRCRDDLERHFGIPVLAQFGPIPERGFR